MFVNMTCCLCVENLMSNLALRGEPHGKTYRIGSKQEHYSTLLDTDTVTRYDHPRVKSGGAPVAGQRRVLLLADGKTFEDVV